MNLNDVVKLLADWNDKISKKEIHLELSDLRQDCVQKYEW